MKKIVNIFLFLNLFIFLSLSVKAEDSIDYQIFYTGNIEAPAALANDDVKIVNDICFNKKTNDPVNGVVSVYEIDNDGHKYLSKKIEYKNGVKDNKSYIYTPNGSVEWSATFLDGNLEGQTRHYLGETWVEYYNIKNDELFSYGSEMEKNRTVIKVNRGGRPYGWLNERKLSSDEAQRLTNQALENVNDLRTVMFNF